MASEATIFIVLEDVNDEIPLFSEREQERVLEGEPVGTVVTRTSAMDRDGTFPNNAVYYYIKKDSEGERYFKIDPRTGEISTKVIFDRESKGAYALEIEARDGAPSARPNSGGEPNKGEIGLVQKGLSFRLGLSNVCLYKFIGSRFCKKKNQIS